MNRRLFIVALLATLSGCGFHLRGSVSLPMVMERTLVTGVASYGELAREIEAGLLQGEAQRVADGAQATARLSVVRDEFDRRVLSVDAGGKVSEYELNYQLTFSLHDAEGRLLLGEQTVSLSRDFAFDSASVLGKGEEETLLRSELRRAAVQQMFRRLHHVKLGG